SIVLRVAIPARSPLFPYTTLFRSVPTGGEYLGRRVGAVPIGRGDGGARSIAAGRGRRRSVRHGDRKQQGNALQGVVAVTIHSARSEEHTSELQSRGHLVCRLLLEK